MLTDAIKHLATDPGTDPKVKRKTLAVLAAWHRQFADDRSMSTVAGLYRQVKPPEPPRRPQVDRAAIEEEERKRREEEERKRREEKAAKEDAKLKARQEKERQRLEEEERKRKAKQPRQQQRKPFDFEQVKCFVVVICLPSFIVMCRRNQRYSRRSQTHLLRQITL
jgi:LAS seventeen-binding protein 5